jgi:release factor glutamine methyltransferase
MPFYSWYEQAKQEAQKAKIDLFELNWLILDFLNESKLNLRLAKIQPSTEQFQQLQALWQIRLSDRLPVQYLLGRTAWRDLELIVSPAVLIPRPETELIIDIVTQVRQELNFKPPEIWLDLGTGSGAIALGLAKNLAKDHSQIEIRAVDLSSEALEIAKRNAKNLDLDRYISWYRGSWFEPLDHLKEKISGMVSNPPYIPTAQVSQLQIEVSKHEPHLALDGGQDGLEAIAQLVIQAPRYLANGGFWLVEIMAGQQDRVRDLLQAQGNYSQIQFHRDRSGWVRFVSALVVKSGSQT